MSKKINQALIPQINKLPNAKKPNRLDQLKNGAKPEFKELFEKFVDNKAEAKSVAPDRGELQFSKHAAKRLEERNLTIDSNEYLKLKEGMQKLQGKGGRESLIVTGNAAYIVDVDKNRIVTAIDKEKMNDNVFTNIDSTVFMM